MHTLIWTSGDYYQKQSFQNVLFPKGLLYDVRIEHYRTQIVNTLIGCIVYLSRNLDETKNRTFLKNEEKSGLVPPSRPNMNDILEDTRDMARIWDLYGHLIREPEIS